MCGELNVCTIYTPQLNQGKGIAEFPVLVRVTQSENEIDGREPTRLEYM